MTLHQRYIGTWATHNLTVPGGFFPYQPVLTLNALVPAGALTNLGLFFQYIKINAVVIEFQLPSFTNKTADEKAPAPPNPPTKMATWSNLTNQVIPANIAGCREQGSYREIKMGKRYVAFKMKTFGYGGLASANSNEPPIAGDMRLVPKAGNWPWTSLSSTAAFDIQAFARQFVFFEYDSAAGTTVQYRFKTYYSVRRQN